MKFLITFFTCCVSFAIVQAVTVDSTLLTVKSGPDSYSDGTPLLDGEIYELLWCPKNGTVKTISTGFAENASLKELYFNVPSTYTNGSFKLIYKDTRDSATTLNPAKIAYAVYESKTATAVISESGLQSIAGVASSDMTVSAVQGSASGTTVSLKDLTFADGIISVNATGTANLILMESTDLKVWEPSSAFPVRAFSAANGIPVDMTERTKFFKFVVQE